MDADEVPPVVPERHSVELPTVDKVEVDRWQLGQRCRRRPQESPRSLRDALQTIGGGRLQVGGVEPSSVTGRRLVENLRFETVFAPHGPGGPSPGLPSSDHRSVVWAPETSHR